MTRGVEHPAELRAQVVAAVAMGESLTTVAKRFGVGKATVERWYRLDGPVQPRNARTREEMGALVYDTVAETLRALTIRALVTGSEDWITRQSAADLAALDATAWDRVIRVLAAFRPDDHPGLDAAGASENA